jgi:hypothetical protein
VRRLFVAVALVVACGRPAQAPPRGDAAAPDPWWTRDATACQHLDTRSALAARYTSPAGRFQLLVCRIPLAVAFPGQGSDAPAVLALVDTRQGHVLERGRVEILWTLEPPEWSPGRVTLGVDYDWRIPPE